MYVIEKQFYTNGSKKTFYYVQGNASYTSNIAEARKFRKFENAEKCVVEIGIGDYKYKKKQGYDVSLRDCINTSFDENKIISK